MTVVAPRPVSIGNHFLEAAFGDAFAPLQRFFGVAGHAVEAPPCPTPRPKSIDPETGAAVPIGEIRELCVRGYHVMLGYHDMPRQTAEAIDPDGWLRSS